MPLFGIMYDRDALFCCDRFRTCNPLSVGRKGHNDIKSKMRVLLVTHFDIKSYNLNCRMLTEYIKNTEKHQHLTFRYNFASTWYLFEIRFLKQL